MVGNSTLRSISKNDTYKFFYEKDGLFLREYPMHKYLLSDTIIIEKGKII